MVFMIADEHRDLKPYAIPVRGLPFKGIKDAKLRELRDELKAIMENLGIVVVGRYKCSLTQFMTFAYDATSKF